MRSNYAGSTVTRSCTPSTIPTSLPGKARSAWKFCGNISVILSAYIKAVRPEIKIIGAQMTDSDAMIRSVKAGRRIALPDVGLFSDGTAVKLVGEETFRITRALVDDFVLVDSDAVCAAIKDVFEDTRSILEPAGALAVAALKQYVAQHRLHCSPSRFPSSAAASSGCAS